jgi:putative acetyltransferase
MAERTGDHGQAAGGRAAGYLDLCRVAGPAGLPAPADAARSQARWSAADAPVTTIRPARDDDADGLIAVVAACFAEYPGCVLDVDREMPQLRAVATAFAAKRGRFWTAERQGWVAGCVGAHPLAEPIERRPAWALVHLYVDPDARRRGLGAHLTGLVETEASACGAGWIDLWSDTRFDAAHRLYERLGYRRLAETRALHDLSASVEYRFRKRLGPARPEGT